MRRSNGWMVCVVALAAGSLASAADWPRWRGPAVTGHVPDGAKLPKTLPDKPKVLWRVPVGDGVGSPVVAGGKVFYLDNQAGKEVVHAAEAHTGKALWRATLDRAFKDAHSPAGPRGTPLVGGCRWGTGRGRRARRGLSCRQRRCGDVLD